MDMEARREFQKKLMAATSADEVFEIMKAGSKEVSMEEAEAIFTKIHAVSGKAELDEEGLDSVVGGSHMTNGKTYSDDVNWLGEHELITTLGNSCKYFHLDPDVSWHIFDTCNNCMWMYSKGMTCYCMCRTEENGL